jgi:hypothetical protein
MKTFISWSGDRSEALAAALKDWLPLILHYAEPWLSRSDIGAGDRWGVEVAKGLEACNFGIICITRENKDAPWILFEAGALAKSMQDGKVIPLLLDLDKKEISGPLAQFQAKKVEQAEIKDLIMSLNKSVADPIPDPNLEKLFSMLWPDLQSKIAAIPEIKATAKPSRPEGEILEDLVSGIRNLEMRFMVMKDMDAKSQELEMIRSKELETRLMMMHEEEANWRRRKGRKLRGVELAKLSRRLASGPADPIQLLFVASLLRDDAPWFYEVALETYRAIKSGNRAEVRISHKRIMDALDLLLPTQLTEEVGLELDKLPMMIEDCFSGLGDPDKQSTEEAGPPSEPAAR